MSLKALYLPNENINNKVLPICGARAAVGTCAVAADSQGSGAAQ